MNIDDVTKQQWEAFRKIQDVGMFNMSSPEAVRASGLDKDTYFEIVAHYDELYAEFEETDDE